MAAKKNTTPPPDQTAAATESEGGAPATDATGGNVPPSQEEQIRQNADRKLEERAGNAAVQLSQAEARANGLEGELNREKAARAAAERQVAELTAALAAATTAASQAGQAIDGLPSNARQLNESVTVHVLSRGSMTPRRAQVKASDVLVATKDDDEVDALQQQLGLQATVYKVSSATLEDLDTSGFLHK